jgi:hypothetical protein
MSALSQTFKVLPTRVDKRANLISLIGNVDLMEKVRDES